MVERQFRRGGPKEGAPHQSGVSFGRSVSLATNRITGWKKLKYSDAVQQEGLGDRVQAVVSRQVAYQPSIPLFYKAVVFLVIGAAAREHQAGDSFPLERHHCPDGEGDPLTNEEEGVLHYQVTSST